MPLSNASSHPRPDPAPPPHPHAGPCKYVLATDRGCSGGDIYGGGGYEDFGGGFGGGGGGGFGGGGGGGGNGGGGGQFEIITENIPCDEAVGYSCVKDLQVGGRIVDSVEPTDGQRPW